MSLLELVQATLGALEEGIHVVDPDGITVFYNAAAAALDGLSVDEVIGRHVLEVFPSLTEESSTLLRVLRTQQPILHKQQTIRNFKGDLITTVNSTIPVLVDGVLLGAVEVSKDITRVRALAEQVVDLQARLSRNAAGGARYTFADLVGSSPVFVAALERARRAALSDAPVLIGGETGTGKELVVHAIHAASRRSAGPLIAQNCAALPEGLLEGLLFGTVRGSFTGAEDRPGLFELANGGTLLLDEINSMALDLQAKLLRVLQDGRVRRLGDPVERPLDVRILATTNVNPLAAVAAGRLRQDLYYRLNVVYLELPPLRARLDDLPLLVPALLAKHGGGRLTPEAAAVLALHDWPGNVRELEHVLAGGLALSTDRVIGLDELPDHLRALVGQGGAPPVAAPATSPVASSAVSSAAEAAVAVWATSSAGEGQLAGEAGPSLKSRVAHLERAEILAALEQCDWNLSAAARRLGLARQTLQYRVRRLGLQRPR